MRIAISGTHSVGKSTVVNEFVAAHRDYIREEEPYRALRAFYDIKFGKESTRYCNGIQLYYNLSRVKQYETSNVNVIFDRSPIDYIAYSLYTAHHHQTNINEDFVNSMIEPVKEALQFLDILVFIPMSEQYPIELENDGIRPTDKDYQEEVDEIFKAIYYEKLYDVLAIKTPPLLIELFGNRQQRIMQLEEAILK